MFGYKLIKNEDYDYLTSKCDAFDNFRDDVIKSDKESKQFRDKMFELNRLLDEGKITYDKYKKLWSENNKKTFQDKES